MKPAVAAAKVRDKTVEFVEQAIEDVLPEVDRKFSIDERERWKRWIMDHLATIYAVEAGHVRPKKTA